MYHRVADDGPASLARWRVSPADFARQIEWLAGEGFRSLSLAEWAAAELGDPAALARRVVLTFDDSYRDFLTTALPVLQHHGFGATMFVPTGFIGGTADWDRGFGEPAPLMSWQELDAVADAGVEIGAHTVTHPRLAGLTDLAAIAHEVDTSRRVLAARYAQPIATFAYPYGDYDARVAKVTEEAGFTAAVTIAPQSAGRFALGRLGVYGDEPFERFVERMQAPPG
jgi:peptidoglycan/xylan/chitin deacetylase (PgdA/CDA1 family)